MSNEETWDFFISYEVDFIKKYHDKGLFTALNYFVQVANQCITCFSNKIRKAKIGPWGTPNLIRFTFTINLIVSLIRLYDLLELSMIVPTHYTFLSYTYH